ncbi:MAG: RNA 2',3'-cyclic phosphodiesterase [Pseudomonadota bacterium]
MPRLFVALALPDAVRTRLSFLRGGLPGARWIDPENFHITLRFIGDVDGDVAEDAAAALTRVDAEPFPLTLTGLGSFGHGRPHSIWAGVDPSTPLVALQDSIERTLQHAGLAPDPRKFTPHVTLARLRGVRPDEVARYLEEQGGVDGGTVHVSRFVLFSSRDSRGGGPYIPEVTYPLPNPYPDPFSNEE